MDSIEYKAQAESPFLNGEVTLAIADNSFAATALFDAAEIPFAEVNRLGFSDYVVTVETDSGDYAFSRMGQWGQPFFDSLFEAYNNAVLRSLFISGDPIISAKGVFSFLEGNATSLPAADATSSRIVIGNSPILVCENCVVSLPPEISARRVPLCFVNEMKKGDFETTLKLDTGESYSFSRLGYDTTPFDDAVEKQIRAQREKALAAVKEIDPSLPPTQASRIAKLMPHGKAAPFGQLAAIAPSFVAALESKLMLTRAAPYYAALKELCDPAQIYVGFRKNETAGGALPDGGVSPGGGLSLGGGLSPSGGLSLDGGVSPGGGLSPGGSSPSGFAGGGAPKEAIIGMSDCNNNDDSETPQADPHLIWLIAPSPDKRHAIVEFAEADAATFIYRTGGRFESFAWQLSRALEAISFRREVIRLSDEDLRRPENANYHMAAKRTASLRFVRSNFAGRVIHHNPDAWKTKLAEICGES